MTVKLERTHSVIINGKNPLVGRVSIQGSKNAALPVLANTVLFSGEVVLHNVPDLSDIRAMLDILSYLGSTYTFEDGVVCLNNAQLRNKRIPDELAGKLRASSILLGPLLARFGEAEVAMPGGCSIGSRAMDIHFKGFEKLGAQLSVENGYVRLQRMALEGEFTLEFPSVGATQNLIGCSVFADGQVILRNFAKEPEVLDLIRFLQDGGADIQFGEDHSSLFINGSDLRPNVQFTIQPDRIEAGTFLMAGFATKGNIQLIGVNPQHLSFPLEKLAEMGADIEIGKDRISLAYKGVIQGTSIKTAVYPGFPTDLQSQMGVLLTQASGASNLTETVFEGRFSYIDELNRMGADIQSVDASTRFFKQSELSGCRVTGFDLRGTASMIMAGLVAEGVTHVSGLEHLYRGYEAYIEKLQHLGADICYI